MSLAILFHFLHTQHVSDINISIIRSLQLCCWITTLVVLFSFRCVSNLTDTMQTQPHQNSDTQRNKNKTTNVVIQQHSRKLLMMDILMSEICWVHKKWNKIASDIKLVFYPSVEAILCTICSTTTATRMWIGLQNRQWALQTYWHNSLTKRYAERISMRRHRHKMTGDRRKEQTMKSFITKYQGGNTHIWSNQHMLTAAQYTVSVSHTVRFKMLTALLLKIQVFQDITVTG